MLSMTGNENRKRSIVLLAGIMLVAGAVVCMAMVGAGAADDHTGNDITFTWESAGDMVTFSGTGELTYDSVKFALDSRKQYAPEKSEKSFTAVIDDRITAIGNYAFFDCGSLTEVVIAADGALTTIGNYAFYNTRITSISIPKKVTTIGEYAFNNCGRLTEVVFAADGALATIGKSAFFSTRITCISIPKSVTTIGDSAFYCCRDLTRVEFAADSALTTIGESAFYNTRITSISIPKSVTTIGGGAFSGCSALEEIELQSGFTPQSLGDSIIFNSNMLYMLAPALPSTTIMEKFTRTNVPVWYITNLGSETATGYYVVDLDGGVLFNYKQNGYTLPKESDISKSGSNLVGWLQSDANTGYVNAVTKGIPVKAVWGTKVDFDNNGATTAGNLESVAISAGNPLIDLSYYRINTLGETDGFTAPVKTGSTFDGYWDSKYKVKYYNADGSPNLTTGISLPSNNKLYAKWNTPTDLGYYKYVDGKTYQKLVVTDAQKTALQGVDWHKGSIEGEVVADLINENMEYAAKEDVCYF